MVLSIQGSFSLTSRETPSGKRGREFELTLKKTGSVSRNALEVPKRVSAKRRKVEPIFLATAIFDFVNFIESPKEESFQTEKMKGLCERITSAATKFPKSLFPFGQIEWDDALFGLIKETFADLCCFLKNHEKEDPSGTISRQKLSDAELDMNSLCEALKRCRRTKPLRSTPEFISEPLSITLTDPSGNESVIASNEAEADVPPILLDLSASEK